MRHNNFKHERHIVRRPHHVAPVLASVRVIHVVHRWTKPSPGTCDHGLSVTIDGTSKILRRAGIHSESWRVKGLGNLIERLDEDHWRTSRPITHVVINTPSFIWPESLAEMAARWPDIEFIQLNHSGNSYLSIDARGVKHIRHMADLQRATHNLRLAGNSRRFAQLTEEAFGVRATYLPNLYDINTFATGPITARRDPDPLRVGNFGAARIWKNCSIAAQAAIIMARRLGVKLEFYVNGDRPDTLHRIIESRQELFDNLPGASLHTVPWANWPQFRRTVSEMDLLLCPSFDETFCVICADGIAEGVPSVVSPAMDWCPEYWRAPPHDASAVARVGLGILHGRAQAVHDGRSALSEFVADGTRRWIDYLTQ